MCHGHLKVLDQNSPPSQANKSFLLHLLTLYAMLPWLSALGALVFKDWIALTSYLLAESPFIYSRHHAWGLVILFGSGSKALLKSRYEECPLLSPCPQTSSKAFGMIRCSLMCLGKPAKCIVLPVLGCDFPGAFAPEASWRLRLRLLEFPDLPTWRWHEICLFSDLRNSSWPPWPFKMLQSSLEGHQPSPSTPTSRPINLWFI